MRRFLLVTVVLSLAAIGAVRQTAPFTLQEVMIPMRDGARLQTVILTPTNSSGPLPILFRRTPYGVPAQPFAQVPASIKELADDGYVFVIQNLRGRFKSEGTFRLTFQADLSDPKATSETTDAYDSIEWLVHNVPNNNGKVGMYGVSYDGLTTAMALLQPHPALKAMSEQAAPVDWWMNDDMHHFGALRESYAFEYAVLEEADKNTNTHFDFDVYDTFSWYLAAGPLSALNARFLHDAIPFWNHIVEHPDYDEFWKREAWIRQLHASTVPNLNVAGFFDQEDPWGPWQIFRHAAEHDPDHTNFMVAGPWYHGAMAQPEGRSHRRDSVRRTRNRARVPRADRGAVLPLLPARSRREAGVARDDVPVGRESVADLRRVAAVRCQADQSVLSLRRPAVVRSAIECDAAVSRVRLRSGQPGAVSRTARVADLPGRRLAHVGGGRPALRGRSPRRSHVRERAAGARSDDHRRSGRRSVCVDVRHRFGLRGEADRRLSRGRAEERVGRRRRAAARTVRALDERL